MRTIELTSSRQGVTPRRAGVFSVLPEAVFLLDETLALVDHNGVGHRWLGLADDADLMAHVHEDDRDLLLSAEAAARAARPGWTPPVPVRLRAADATWRTWSITFDNRLADRDVRAVVVLARDVTSRWSTGTTAPDAVLREVLHAAPLAVIALDRAGRVRYAGGAGLVVAPDQLVGRLLVDLVEHDEQRAHIADALAGHAVDSVSCWGGRWWSTRFRPVVHDGVFDGSVGVFLDVTQRHEAEEASAAALAYLEGVLEAVQEALIVIDAGGRISTANTRFRTLFGAGARSGTSLAEVVDPGTARLLEQQIQKRSQGRSGRYELRLRDADGAPLWVLVSASPLRDPDGRFLGSVAVLTDITAHKEAERRLALVAHTDPVTGVGSRATLDARLEAALNRRHGIVAVLFCDVDGLKQVNDEHGHAVGDVLLRETAARIRSVLRPSDTVTRYGGDEFVVVADELPDDQEARLLAERVRSAVDAPFAARTGVLLHPTVSVGLATSPPAAGGTELLTAADSAVYAAKTAGRNVVRSEP